VEAPCASETSLDFLDVFLSQKTKLSLESLFTKKKKKKMRRGVILMMMMIIGKGKVVPMLN
jgi:hypothetical protein